MANMNPPPNLEPQIQSSMPIPIMQYVNQYTAEAVRRGACPKPPQPPKESYQMFGQTCHQDDAIMRPLEAQGLLRLHPEPYNKREELKKITVSILCNFLDLLDILVKAGTTPGRDQKIEDLNLLFIHMHHLINEFRPHQARETLKVMMNMQKKNMVDAGEQLGKHINKAAEILHQCSEDLVLLKCTDQSGGQTDAEAMDTEGPDGPEPRTGAVLANGLPGPESDVTANHDDKDSIMCGMVDGIND